MQNPYPVSNDLLGTEWVSHMVRQQEHEGRKGLEVYIHRGSIFIPKQTYGAY